MKHDIIYPFILFFPNKWSDNSKSMKCKQTENINKKKPRPWILTSILSCLPQGGNIIRQAKILGPKHKQIIFLKIVVVFQEKE